MEKDQEKMDIKSSTLIYIVMKVRIQIIEYLTGKRSDVLFRDIERGLMLSGMLDKVKGAIAYEKVSGRNN